MKKLICLALAMFLLTGAAFASQAYECEMTENEVLTVRLDANATTGYEWQYVVSDESLIDMITNEYTADDVELDGAGGQFVISFKAMQGVTGEATITFNYVSPSGESEQAVVLSVRAEDGEIFFDGGVCVAKDDEQLVVSLGANATTGYEWTYALDKEGYLVPVSEDYAADDANGMVGVGGTYKAVFETAMEEAGMVTITFGYARPWEDAIPEKTVKVDVWVVESGDFQIDKVEVA